ncbi:DUF2812 domain-containing protein [uncultured Oscillibacter sp.]|uniref:DUF2812 domain-containing protein n=1 Tax=uncultured Oscillibacter sp. TaxID=876091 RepID=UPI0025FA7E6A|nr:DUF2812 domain-containing protein [uncultured Oscillibacter sp.]
MRETKRTLMWYEFYQDANIEEHLENMAAKGWRLEKIGYLLRYRRAKPARVRYAVTYFSESSEFNPSPTENEETLREYCTAAGWDFVAAWHQMLIFSTLREDAPPIETEGAVKLEAIHRAMKKNFLPSGFALLALFGFNLAMQLRLAERNLPSFLADGVQLGAALVMLLLVCHFLSILCSYFLWYRDAKRSVEQGGGCPKRRSRFARTRQTVLLAAEVAVLFFLYIPAAVRVGQGTLEYILFVLCGYGFLVVAVQLVRGWLKRRGVSAWTNRIVSIGLSFVLGAGIIGGSVFYALRGHKSVQHGAAETEVYVTRNGTEHELRRDPLPLKIEDLQPIEELPWSYELTEHWSPLALMREGRQVEYENWESLDYGIFDVKTDFLYRACLRDYLRTEELLGLEYSAVGEAQWGADVAYRLSMDGEEMNSWILCRNRRIVSIAFDWTPTPAQMALAGEKLLAGT